MRFNLATIIAAAGALALTATAAVAEPAADGRGEFTVAMVAQDQYAVVYRGDTRLSRRDVAARALRQAAQATIDNGKEWFFVRETLNQRINLATEAALDELGRGQGSTRDTSAGAGGEIGGARGGGNSATAGVDPGAVGVGTQAPSALLERRRPRMAYQTVLIVQVGSGDEVTITGMSEAPEIFDAQALLTDN